MIFHVGNQRTRLETDNQKLLEVLNRKYTRKIPGAHFSSKYRRGYWKGTKEYFTKKGTFGTGLLSHIIKDLELVGLDYEINDTRETYELEEPFVEGLTLRDYQTRIVDSALLEKRCIIEAPTASGKTPILAYLLSALEGRKGIIFFTKKSILTQTYEFLKKFGFDVGLCFGDGFIMKDVMLCTAQSVGRILDTHLDAEFIMFDEVHEFANGKIGKALISSFKKAYVRIGMSATVPKDHIPRLNLVAGLGKIINEVSAKELVDEGWLTDPKITLIDMKEPDLSKCDGFGYEDYYQRFIIRSGVRNGIIRDIVKDVQSTTESSKVLILVKNIEHAEILNVLIPDSVIVQGKDPLSVRDKKVSNFVNSTHGVIIGTVVFQTGINIPEITHFINARALKSEIATIQAMGRAFETT